MGVKISPAGFYSLRLSLALRNFVFAFAFAFSLALVNFCPLIAIANSDEELFKRSLQFFSERKFTEASITLKDLIERYPTNLLYWFNHGCSEFMRDHPESALRSFGVVISRRGKLAPAAQIYAAKALTRLDRIDEAQEILETLSSTSLPMALAQMATAERQLISDVDDLQDDALEFYQSGNFEGTLFKLRQKKPEDLTHDGQILLGLTLIRRKMYIDANGVLQRLSQSQMNSEKKIYVLNLLRYTRNRESDRAGWTSLDLALGYTSNVFLEGQSVSALPSVLTRTLASAGYHFRKNQPLSAKLGYSLSYEDATSARELRILAHTIQTPLLWRAQQYQFVVSPFFNSQDWGGEPTLQKFGSAIRNQLTFDRFDFGLDAEFFSQRALNTSVDYLSGSCLWLRPSIALWSHQLWFQAHWILGQENVSDIKYSDGSALPLNHTYQGPGMKLILKQRDSLVWLFNLAFLEKKFRSLALPGSRERVDRELTTSIKAVFWSSNRLSFFLQGEFLRNSSTLGDGDVRDKNYELLTGTTGLTLDMF